MSAFSHSRDSMMRDLHLCDHTINSINVLTFHTYFATLGVCLAVSRVPQLMEATGPVSSAEFNRTAGLILTDMVKVLDRFVTKVEPPRFQCGRNTDVAAAVCDGLLTYAVNRSSQTVLNPVNQTSRRDAELAGDVAASRTALDIVQNMMAYYNLSLPRDPVLIATSIARCEALNAAFLDGAMARQRLYYACCDSTPH